MTYDLSRPDGELGGSIGAALQPFRHRNATVRDAAALRLKLDQWRRYATEKAGHKALQRGALRLLRRLVLANPVGNPALWKTPRKGYVGGHSRRNWQVARSPLVPELPGVKPAGQVISEGAAKIAAIPPRTRSVFLSNPVPYMLRLNRGWSRQAPPGWIDNALQQTLAEMRRIK